MSMSMSKEPSARVVHLADPSVSCRLFPGLVADRVFPKLGLRLGHFFLELFDSVLGERVSAHKG